MRAASLLLLPVLTLFLACQVADYDARGSACDDAHSCPNHLACVEGICGGTASSPSTDGGLCTGTQQCGNGFVCTGGSCTGCSADAGCPLGEACSNGLCTPDCTVSLAAIAAQSANAIIIPSCLYRDTITLDHPHHVYGRAGAEIRGSDVFVRYDQDGGLFYSSATVPTFPLDSCEGDLTACANREQVFWDGAPLAKSTYPPGPGQFALDTNRHVFLADNPAGHTVEVSTRSHWVVATSDDVHLSGLILRHAVSGVTTGALSNYPQNNFSVDHCVIAQAAGACVVLRGTAGLSADHLTVGPCAADGIRLNNVDGGLVTNNVIFGANQTGMMSTADAASAALHMSGMHLTATENQVLDGGAVGIYVANAVGGAVDVENNLVQNVAFNGLQLHEVANAIVAGNRILYSGYGPLVPAGWGLGAGILVHDSHDVEVSHNLVAWSSDGIAVISQAAPAPWGQVYGVTVHDNVVANGADGSGPESARLDLGFLTDQAPTMMWDGGLPNSGHDNRYWNPVPESLKRFAWVVGLPHLSDFAATQGGRNDTYLSDAGLSAILLDAGFPLSDPFLTP